MLCNRISAHVECEEKVVPVITVATATITNLLRQHQNSLLGKHEIKKLEKKSAILGTVNVLQKVLM